MLAFGEACRYKNRSPQPFSNVADGRRFHLGVVVGVDGRTGQYMVHDGDTVKLARTVIRLPEVIKWDKEALLSNVCDAEGPPSST